MTPVERKEFEDMKKALKELVAFVEEKKRQQIKMPLDNVSKNVLYENIPVYVSKTTNTPTADGYITTVINGRTVTLLTGA